MASGDIVWPPETGTTWRVGDRVYTLTSIVEGTEEAVMSPAATEGRRDEGFRVLREEWEEFTASATQVNV